MARAANSSWELVLLNAGDVVICEVDYFRITVTKLVYKVHSSQMVTCLLRLGGCFLLESAKICGVILQKFEKSPHLRRYVNNIRMLRCR